MKHSKQKIESTMKAIQMMVKVVGNQPMMFKEHSTGKVLGFIYQRKQSKDCVNSIIAALKKTKHGSTVKIYGANDGVYYGYLTFDKEHKVLHVKSVSYKADPVKKSTSKKSTGKKSTGRRTAYYKGRKYYSAPIGRTVKEAENGKEQCWLNNAAKNYKQLSELMKKQHEWSDEIDLALLLNGPN